MVHLLLAIIYLGFISLGLPDALLGSAWPTMYQEFGVPVSFAGGIAMIISVGTILSSLQSDRLTRKFGTGKVTAISVALTATALFGFSISQSYWALCLWAIPYGLGAGGVDASLNNYVAVHYTSRHMSWLHCMWGVGASLGPYVMAFALNGGNRWNMGYTYIALIQVALTALLLLSLPLWKKRHVSAEEADNQALTMKEILTIPGAKEIMVTFFCYCALEQTAALWASSYLVLHKGVSTETAAAFASLFFIGITVGRAISGFLTMRYTDTQMIRLGEMLILSGIVLLVLPSGERVALAGLIMVGLGCAPVYPCIIHSTPDLFGADKSQAIIGVQMAAAYVGPLMMPPLFGLIANYVHPGLFPFYLGAILVVMVMMYESLLKKKSAVLVEN